MSIALLGCTAVHAQPTAPAPGAIDPATGLRSLPYAVNSGPARYAHLGATLIRNVRLIDGLGNPARAQMDILVKEGRIARIAPGGRIATEPGVKVIDGAGLTVLPGLMDLHVHMVGMDRFATAMVRDPRQLSDLYRYKSYLYGYLYSGVTTVLDVGTVPSIGVGLKRLIDEDYVLGPRYFWSGPIMEGGVELSAPFSDRMQLIPTSAQIAPTLDYLQLLGVDFVKLYRRTPTWMLERISAEAHKRGMRVIIDAWERNGFAELQRIGRIDGAAHLNFHFPLSAADVKAARDANSFVITTFYAINAFSGRLYASRPNYFDSPLIADILPPEYLQPLKAAGGDPLAMTRPGLHAIAIADFQDLMGFAPDTPTPVLLEQMSKIGGQNLRKLLDAGVLIAAGTDGGQGESLLSELELIVSEAGVTPIQAIQMATGNAARVLRKEAEFGSIQPGLIADLVLVRGTPDTNVSDLRNVVHVFKAGRMIDRPSLTRQWGY
jgi:imidazolonepropionase-like amidohydrolase